MRYASTTVKPTPNNDFCYTTSKDAYACNDIGMQCVGLHCHLLNLITYFHPFVGAPIVYDNRNELIGVGAALTGLVILQKSKCNFSFLI